MQGRAGRQVQVVADLKPRHLRTPPTVTIDEEPDTTPTRPLLGPPPTAAPASPKEAKTEPIPEPEETRDSSARSSTSSRSVPFPGQPQSPNGRPSKLQAKQEGQDQEGEEEEEQEAEKAPEAFGLRRLRFVFRTLIFLPELNWITFNKYNYVMHMSYPFARQVYLPLTLTIVG